MEETQGRFEVGDARIAGRDDRHAPPMLVLQRRNQQRPRLDRGAGDVETAVAVEELPEERSLRDARAKIGDEGIVTVQGRSLMLRCEAPKHTIARAPLIRLRHLLPTAVNLR